MVSTPAISYAQLPQGSPMAPWKTTGADGRGRVGDARHLDPLGVQLLSPTGPRSPTFGMDVSSDGSAEPTPASGKVHRYTKSNGVLVPIPVPTPKTTAHGTIPGAVVHGGCKLGGTCPTTWKLVTLTHPTCSTTTQVDSLGNPPPTRTHKPSPPTSTPPS